MSNNMQWMIPAKTFLLGEYAAIEGLSALLVTTKPCFYMTTADKAQSSIKGIHPQSPAGLWWQQQNINTTHLIWSDPYLGCGGLGASSAQFIGSYLASCSIQGKKPSLESLLDAYYQCAWNNRGLKPSGYDVIAQTQSGCVFINKQQHEFQCFAWPFSDLSFFLIHTGNKLATHHHLQKTSMPAEPARLSALVDLAKKALEHADSTLFIECINNYHQQLMAADLVATQSIKLIDTLRAYPEVRAIKGCGALGADVILLITSAVDAPLLKKKLEEQNKKIVASEQDILVTNEFSVF